LFFPWSNRRWRPSVECERSKLSSICTILIAPYVVSCHVRVKQWFYGAFNQYILFLSCHVSHLSCVVGGLRCLSIAPPPESTKFRCYILPPRARNDTYDHRTLKIDLPFRSAVFRGTVLGELSCALVFPGICTLVRVPVSWCSQSSAKLAKMYRPMCAFATRL
jgi:hypothetical protein